MKSRRRFAIDLIVRTFAIVIRVHISSCRIWLRPAFVLSASILCFGFFSFTLCIHCLLALSPPLTCRVHKSQFNLDFLPWRLLLSPPSQLSPIQQDNFGTPRGQVFGGVILKRHQAGPFRHRFDEQVPVAKISHQCFKIFVSIQFLEQSRWILGDRLSDTTRSRFVRTHAFDILLLFDATVDPFREEGAHALDFQHELEYARHDLVRLADQIFVSNEKDGDVLAHPELVKLLPDADLPQRVFFEDFGGLLADFL
mmetsp:Transcript_35144/g.74159  ORF Transcript_35144/g.74159 Transcript_35144/m.74159 type:complete len:254 (-) Transcript_35144:1452-2213(-)